MLVAAFEAVVAVGLTDMAPRDLDAPAPELPVDADEIDRLVAERDEARSRGDFAVADEIRGRLDVLGVELRDTAAGTVLTVRRA